MERNLLKSNKGSTLVMSIVIIILMATLCMAIMMLTMSEMNMSRLYGDVNRAYFNAEAGIDKAVKAADQIVARCQEAAKDHIDSLPVPSNCINDDGTIDYEAYQTFLQTQYHIRFNEVMNAAFTDLNTSPESILFGITDGSTELNLASDGTNKDGTVNISNAVLTVIPYTDTEDGINKNSYTLNVTVRGVYNSITKTVQASMDLLAETQTRAVPYTFSFRRPVIGNPPPIFQKAVVAGRNLLAYEGNTTINGDVLAFGTIPQAGGEEDQDASWNEYGGIMAGVSEDFVNSIENRFGIHLPDYNSRTAKLTINGNAATMSGIHALYGANETNYSEINVSGNAFARSVRTEGHSKFSKIAINGDAYVLDNTELLGMKTDVTINGKYLGIVDNPENFGGSGEDLDKSSYQFKRTSAVVVSGEDSNLNLNGEVYIAGSNFFMDYTQNIGTERRPYMAGISALTSTTKIPNAFIYNAVGNNTFYDYYDADTHPIDNPWTIDNLVNSSNTDDTKDRYFYNSEDGPVETNMFYKKNTDSGIIGLNIFERASHFRVFWEKKWKGIYDLNINYGDGINIAVNDQGQIRGYSSGAIIANGKVYGTKSYGGFSEINTNGIGYNNINYFQTYRDGWRDDFRRAIMSLLNETLTQTSRLNYVQPSRILASPSNNAADNNEYMDSRWVVDGVQPGRVQADFPLTDIPAGGTNRGFFYFGNGDVYLVRNAEGNLSVGTSADNVTEVAPGSTNCGIIYARGNIYVEPDVEFRGTLLTDNNVIVRDDNSNLATHTTLTCDNTITNMLETMLKRDVRLQGLFRMSGSNDPNASTVQTQKLQSRNVILRDIRQIGN